MSAHARKSDRLTCAGLPSSFVTHTQGGPCIRCCHDCHRYWGLRHMQQLRRRPTARRLATVCVCRTTSLIDAAKESSPSAPVITPNKVFSLEAARIVGKGCRTRETHSGDIGCQPASVWCRPFDPGVALAATAPRGRRCQRRWRVGLARPVGLRFSGAKSEDSRLAGSDATEAPLGPHRARRYARGR